MRAHLTELMEIQIVLLGKKHVSEKLTFVWKVLLHRSNLEGSKIYRKTQNVSVI